MHTLDNPTTHGVIHLDDVKTWLQSKQPDEVIGVSGDITDCVMMRYVREKFGVLYAHGGYDSARFNKDQDKVEFDLEVNQLVHKFDDLEPFYPATRTAATVLKLIEQIETEGEKTNGSSNE